MVLPVQDLSGCANTLIGDELQGIKGISGGQRRRVSVGIELVKDPHIIFLDGEVLFPQKIMYTYLSGKGALFLRFSCRHKPWTARGVHSGPYPRAPLF